MKEKNNDKKLNEELEPEITVFPELWDDNMFIDALLNSDEIKNKK